MGFHIIEGDITKFSADAVVNAANTSLLGGGGVDGAIHRAAGPGLLKECQGLHGCKTGQAKITAGYNLPAKHIIHTPGPIWQGGTCGEDGVLACCYRNCLRLAEENGCRTIAFPSISIAVREISGFLKDSKAVREITMVCFDGHTKAAYEAALEDCRRSAGQF